LFTEQGKSNFEKNYYNLFKKTAATGNNGKNSYRLEEDTGTSGEKRALVLVKSQRGGKKNC